MAHRVGAHLAREVDLDGRVDGDDLFVLRDERGVVGAVAGVELHLLIVMHEVEELSGAGHEGHDDSARVHLLLAVGDDAAFDEGNEAVGEHLGAHAEHVLVAEPREHRIGNAADPQLQTAAVFDEVGDELSSGGLDVARLSPEPSRQRPVSHRERRHLLERQHRVPQRARHLRVDLCDDRSRVPGCGQRRVHRRAERAVEMRVGHRELHERDVEPELNSDGMSERKIGMKSARPSEMGPRSAPPVKSETEKNRPACWASTKLADRSCAGGRA